jgi:hypothetical protein
MENPEGVVERGQSVIPFKQVSVVKLHFEFFQKLNILFFECFVFMMLFLVKNIIAYFSYVGM